MKTILKWLTIWTLCSGLVLEVLLLDSPKSGADILKTQNEDTGEDSDSKDVPKLKKRKSKSIDHSSRRQDAAGGLKNACFMQSCDQTVTGRGLNYARSLKIVQDEEYLSKADTDLIRRNDVFDEWDNSTDLSDHEDLWPTIDRIVGEAPMFENSLINFNFTHHRSKRQVYSIPGAISFDYCSYKDSLGYVSLYFKISDLVGTYCASCITGPSCTVPYAIALALCNYDFTCLSTYPLQTVSTQIDCVYAYENFLYTYISHFCYFVPAVIQAEQAYTSEKTPTVAGGLIIPGTLGIAAVAGVGGLPTFPMVTSSGTPPGAPAPGTPLGGGTPGLFTAVGISALALVPLGLTAVAVFPPYAKTRTLEAISVIFSEDPDVKSINSDVTTMRTKRDLWHMVNRRVRRSQRRPSTVTEVVDLTWKKFVKKTKILKKAVKHYMDEAMCWKTRIKVAFMVFNKMRKERISPKKKKRRRPTDETTENSIRRFKRHDDDESKTKRQTPSNETTTTTTESSFRRQDESNTKRQRPLDETTTITESSFRRFKRQDDESKAKRRRKKEKVIDSMDDCFTNMPEPKYGFAAKIDLVKNQPCKLGSTCKLNFIFKNGKKKNPDSFRRRQSGEEFKSKGPPDCRIVMDSKARC